ncbi:hypothetical protein D051_0038 [Vibrio parahaemolyticus VPCR-2010]|nr:hypothetical protein D051_0038 [Vibrio parahaemolyticus VPCR-2010]
MAANVPRLAEEVSMLAVKVPLVAEEFLRGFWWFLFSKANFKLPTLY